MKPYLIPSPYIDFDTPSVREQARALRGELHVDKDIAAACFLFVRDAIHHSWDHRQNPVTCRASEALRHRTGYCYAKSHLLAALLRANGIPAGLCYQRLSVGESGPPYCLHGLNAVYLEGFGWYRCDARGNKSGVDAQFTPPREALAFPLQCEDEADLPGIWAEPLPEILDVLERASSIEDVYVRLPDVNPASERFDRAEPKWIQGRFERSG